MVPVLGLVLAAIAWSSFATLWNLGFWPDLATPRLLSLFSGFCVLAFAALFACAEGTRGMQRLFDYLLVIECCCMLAGAVMRALAVSGGATYWTVEIQGRFIGMIGNPNVTAALAAVFGVYSLYRISRLFSEAKSKSEGVIFALFAISCVINLAILAVTGSRLPYLLSIPALFYGLKAILKIKRAKILYKMAVASIVVLAVFTIFYINGDVTAERMHAISADWAGRVDFWTQVAGIAERSLWLGYGLGGFSDIYMHFLANPHLAAITWPINSAHNIIMQIIMVGGIPYLFTILAASLLIIFKIMMGLKRNWNRLYGALIGMALIFLSYALIDIDLDMPVSVTLFLLLVGLLWGAAIRNALNQDTAGDHVNSAGRRQRA